MFEVWAISPVIFLRVRWLPVKKNPAKQDVEFWQNHPSLHLDRSTLQKKNGPRILSWSPHLEGSETKKRDHWSPEVLLTIKCISLSTMLPALSLYLAAQATGGMTRIFAGRVIWCYMWNHPKNNLDSLLFRCKKIKIKQKWTKDPSSLRRWQVVRTFGGQGKGLVKVSEAMIKGAFLKNHS